MELYPTNACIVRTVQALNRNLYNEVLAKVTPLSDDLTLIPEVYRLMGLYYPDMDRTDRSIMIVCTVYRIFSPEHFIHSGFRRAPNGIREPVCQLMNWPDAPVLNHYLNIAMAYYKGKSYRQKVHFLIECLGLKINH